MLRRCSNFVPIDCLLSIYSAFVFSHLSYDIQFWGISIKQNLSKLHIAQKACIRKIVIVNQLICSLCSYC